MAVQLTLRTDDADRLTVTLDGQPLAGATPLADLPALPALQAASYDQGRALTRALGGDVLLTHLQSDPERTLLLEADDAAAAIPWEFAALEGRQLLACRYAMLRLVDRPGGPAPAPDTLHFVVLAADPLVDEHGHAREGYRLRLDAELRALRRTLDSSQVHLLARRVPPTRDALRRALRRGPVILHLTCHGNVIPGPDGPIAVLALEDRDGGAVPLLGSDLIALPPPGVLRLVLLSACHTAKPEEGDGTLARALVQNGVPAAVGMQGKFPDRLSEPLAVALYESLLSGYSLAEALRQARLSLSTEPSAAGLPVGYVARDGWDGLPLRPGAPSVRNLRLPGRISLSQDIQPPRPLRGRNGELHELAQRYSQGGRVVTVVGSGGIGKTALAATFAERFGYRWPHVLGVSFASGDPDAARFRDELLRSLLGAEAAARLASAPDGEQTRALLAALRDWDGLLLLDNYESILHGLSEGDPEASAVHGLVAQAANGGTTMLLTSRRQPAGLAGEAVFPETRRPLPGLGLVPGAGLFLHHSTRAKGENETGPALARDVARVTEGHPLAIALLAGEYDVSDVPPAGFLDHWADELAGAERHGLAGHHRTFAVAFNRSYERLPAPIQARLRALSRFPFPFLVQGAALLWGLTTDGADLSAAREHLGEFTRRSLLEVEGWFEDGTPATYRFQPALQQALARRVGDDERAALDAGYGAYGDWLARRGYEDIHRVPALARLVRRSLDALDAAADHLEGNERLWHVWRLAWLKGAYGQTEAAYDLLESVLPPGQPMPDAERDPEAARVASSLRYELAKLCVTRGDLDRALALYQAEIMI